MTTEAGSRFPFLHRVNIACQMPSLPKAASRILLLLQSDPPPSPREAVASVLKDPATAFKLMRVICDRRIISDPVLHFQDAIEILGIDTLRVLVEVQSLVASGGKIPAGRAKAMSDCWRHSVKCAITAGHLASSMGRPPFEAYLAGLFHDIGKLLLWVNFPGPYDAILQDASDADGVEVAERSKFGVSHSQFAADLFRAWDLSILFCDAIRYHHRPLSEMAEALPLVRILSVAHHLCCREGQDPDWAWLAGVLGCGIRPAQLQARMENAGREARKAVSELTDVPGRPKSAMGTLPDSSDAGGAAFQLQQDYLAAGAWARLSAANPGGRPQKILLDCLQLVFDVRSAFFFYYDPVPHALIGRPCRNVGRDRSIDRMALPVRNEGSLVSRSFLDQNILDSFGYLKETSLAITDEQVIRLLGTDGMICLPMTFRSNPVGIVLAGIDEPQYPSISVHLERLRQIAALCAVLYGNSGSALFARRSESATGFVKDAPSLQKIVHEVNNPLGIVRTYLKLIAGKFDGTPDVREEIGVIEEEMERVRRLIGQLSPAETPELFPVQPLGLDFNGVLRNLSRILERSILNPANIRIHFHLAPDLPPYPGERSGIIQIFINLIKNAVEAMPGGGNIYVETRRLGQAGGGDGLCVTVRDDGPGIPQAIIDSLFEPGKTTKGIQHSGLGLSIVRDIVKRLSGKVACASCAGAGTTVRIDLPFEAEGLDRPSGG